MKIHKKYVILYYWVTIKCLVSTLIHTCRVKSWDSSNSNDSNTTHFSNHFYSNFNLTCNQKLWKRCISRNNLDDPFEFKLPRFYISYIQSLPSFCSPTCLKAKFRRKKNIYSNKFFHNFHLSESSFTCPRLHASGLVIFDSNDIFIGQ